jgi:hypothetical protein
MLVTAGTSGVVRELADGTRAGAGAPHFSVNC